MKTACTGATASKAKAPRPAKTRVRMIPFLAVIVVPMDAQMLPAVHFRIRGIEHNQRCVTQVV
jgi:hypothetical protein